MRSSPHVRLAVVISAMSCRSSTGIRGRPRGHDFACQKRRYRFRCHRTSVRSLRSDLAFDVTGELLPQEQVLGPESRAGSEGQSKQPQQVNNQGERHSEHVRESCRPEPIALVKPAAHANRISADRASATKNQGTERTNLCPLTAPLGRLSAEPDSFRCPLRTLRNSRALAAFRRHPPAAPPGAGRGSASPRVQ